MSFCRSGLVISFCAAPILRLHAAITNLCPSTFSPGQPLMPRSLLLFHVVRLSSILFAKVAEARLGGDESEGRVCQMFRWYGFCFRVRSRWRPDDGTGHRLDPEGSQPVKAFRLM